MKERREKSGRVTEVNEKAERSKEAREGSDMVLRNGKNIYMKK